MNYTEETISWIKSGRIGCVFATALVTHAKEIGWQFQIAPENLNIPPNCHILSLIFPDEDVNSCKEWALKNGFYIEDVHEMYEGLRIKIGSNVSWVQYFGPDSHVKTRQSPYPMLSFTVKMPPMYYAKVGFKGILHLAHASIQKLTNRAADRMWERSHEKTARILGYKPTIREAAKTTYEKNTNNRTSATS